MLHARFAIRKPALEGELCFSMHSSCDFLAGFAEGTCQNSAKHACHCREPFQLLVAGRMDKLRDVTEHIHMGADSIAPAS